MFAFIKIKALVGDEGVTPRLTVTGSSLELYSFCISESGRANHVLIPPRSVKKVRTGFSVKIAAEFYGLILSLPARRESTLFPVNELVVLPASEEEIILELYNGGHESQHVGHGQLIGRMILSPFVQMELRKEVVNDSDQR